MNYDYFSKVSVLDFARLALDVYHDPKDRELLRKEFNPLWQKIDEWPRKAVFQHSFLNVGPGGTTHGKMNGSRETDPKTGFYASFYRNMATDVGVLVIRGTDSIMDGIEDYHYATNLHVDQYAQASTFWHIIKDYYLITDAKKLYICGHSLGGIIAKMIAPITGADTIAFNSSGVTEYLKNNHLQCQRASYDQVVVTYCANGDPVGNLNHVGDISEYRFLSVLGEEKMSDLFDKIEPNQIENSIQKMKQGLYNHSKKEIIEAYNSLPEYDQLAITNKMKYHSMNIMYKALKDSIYKNNYI